LTTGYGIDMVKDDINNNNPFQNIMMAMPTASGAAAAAPLAPLSSLNNDEMDLLRNNEMHPQQSAEEQIRMLETFRELTEDDEEAEGDQEALPKPAEPYTE